MLPSLIDDLVECCSARRSARWVAYMCLDLQFDLNLVAARAFVACVRGQGLRQSTWIAAD